MSSLPQYQARMAQKPSTSTNLMREQVNIVGNQTTDPRLRSQPLVSSTLKEQAKPILSNKADKKSLALRETSANGHGKSSLDSPSEDFLLSEGCLEDSDNELSNSNIMMALDESDESKPAINNSKNAKRDAGAHSTLLLAESAAADNVNITGQINNVNKKRKYEEMLEQGSSEQSLIMLNRHNIKQRKVNELASDEEEKAEPIGQPIHDLSHYFEESIEELPSR